MTRQLSIGMLKNNKGRKNVDGKPSLGTGLRDIYDRLRRGEHLHIKSFGKSRAIQNVLRDQYGIEFESKKGKNGYIRLKGECCGPYYVEREQIIAEQEAEDNASKS